MPKPHNLDVSCTCPLDIQWPRPGTVTWFTMCRNNRNKAWYMKHSNHYHQTIKPSTSKHQLSHHQLQTRYCQNNNGNVPTIPGRQNHWASQSFASQQRASEWPKRPGRQSAGVKKLMMAPSLKQLLGIICIYIYIYIYIHVCVCKGASSKIMKLNSWYDTLDSRPGNKTCNKLPSLYPCGWHGKGIRRHRRTGIHKHSG